MGAKPLIPQLKGTILVTTIIMISILTMLTLTLMQTVFIYLKVSQQVVKNHELFYELETIARVLSSESYSLDCLLTNEEPNKVLELLRDHYGCHRVVGKHQYDYLIDDLGYFPCLTIVERGKDYSSHHWLVNVATNTLPQMMLQLRLAKRAGEMDCQSPSKRQIDPGTVSWRYLS